MVFCKEKSAERLENTEKISLAILSVIFYTRTMKWGKVANFYCKVVYFPITGQRAKLCFSKKGTGLCPFALPEKTL